MVVQPAEPCRIRYRKRDLSKQAAAQQQTPQTQHTQITKPATAGQCPFSGAVLTASGEKASHKIAIDLQLCQGHGVCMGESPELFQLNTESGIPKVLQENIGETLLAKAKNAEKFCPNQAIKVTALM
jgi:sterol 14-demethylase